LGALSYSASRPETKKGTKARRGGMQRRRRGDALCCIDVSFPSFD